jgi:hypothetical protein
MEVDGAVAHYTSIEVQNLWALDPGTLNASAPTFLFVDTADLDSQWRGHLPHELYQSLSATGRLHPSGAHMGWSLFQVR